MRSFIGLDLSATEKLALDSWRQQALPEIMPRQWVKNESSRSRKSGNKRNNHNSGQGPSLPYAVPAANFHITLSFLGEINHRQHEALVYELDQLVSEPFSLTLDATGLWNGPKILFAAPTNTPKALSELAKLSRKAARKAAIEVENREYKPHVTVVRKATSTLPLPLYSPSVDVHVSAFHLFESVTTPQGVTYPVRQSWPLKHNMSVREKLRRGITDE
ncbi:RNA 2',3'-cyclic phosphodiesterase [Alteromonas sp.]|uniref:RNA 2',3'-cyclic phosphodiesterase n=1 Tax=Alteromonas sp. TaxID=232 RepID=UPI00257AA31A|nr:RNA 2',3'-cyclic phosphodiesterase [Alteromonas sp.]NQY19347.1 RNA 2',3'-cyclic phosphodiesterase [Alteromonas sp.]